jgi:hypothetical protein
MSGHCLFIDGDCATYECCVNKKMVVFCFQCDEFPCMRLAPSLDSAERGYPHNIKLYNLGRIKAIGVEKWAEQEVDDIRELYYNGRYVMGDSAKKR